ncbi:MAG TPA: HlyD family efflux transporter periplasmic adaptor subunit [Candidatus Absconditabacterales bacterium]|nr:HlyD family efflux transporter periplasmic adaptor subunit [Candidatus Absconditabacterales bacterium]
MNINLQKIIQEAKSLVVRVYKQNRKMTIVTIATLLLIIVVTIFSKQERVNTDKIDFYANTQSIEDFGNNIQIDKPGKMIGAEEIVLSAQAMGSIKSIDIKEGDTVGNKQTLINIDDTIANYGILVQRAKNALNSARLQYSQSKTQLEQGISNSQLALQQSQTSLSTVSTLGEQNIRGAENSLNNSNTQKNSLVLQMESEKNKLQTFLSDVLHKNDDILGATTQYKSNNDSYEIYLSAKNTSFKLQGKNQLLDLYKQKDILEGLNVSSEISNTEIKENIATMNTIYSKINALLNTMENIFIKSVSSTTFPQATIDGLIAANNGLQATYNGNFSYFTSFKQSADSALIDNGNGELVLGNESADIGYQTTIASTNQQISDAQIGLESAQLNYDTAVRNKSNTLGLAATNITSAELAYQEALKQYEKLKVQAPITGTIGKILVDKGQEIGVGTPLVTVINNSDPIVEVGITAAEYNKINSGSIVKVNYMDKAYTGNIVSIASQAGNNGLYNIIIQLEEKVDIIGDTAEIQISSNIDKFMLPLNLVHPLEKNEGYIYILKDGEPETLNIELGQIRGNEIEVLSQFPQGTEIIMNNIENYNPNIHNLVIE